MSLSSAKAKLDAQPGDPATGYISKQDHKDSYDELVADTALTGATTAQDLTVNGRDVDNLIAGPASATDNALVRFDGTGGKTAQNSGIVVDDSNNVTGMGTLASGAVTSSGAVQAAAGSGFVVGSSGPTMRSGTGSPEGAVTAPVGSIWFQTDSTVGVSHWRKASGTGNTGWVPFAQAATDLYLPGTSSGDFVSAPDSAALSITGDLDLRIWGTFTAGTTQVLINKDNVASDRGYALGLEASGTLTLRYSTDGAGTGEKVVTSSTAVTGTQTIGLRVTLDVDNGAGGRTVKFYTSSDFVTWSQLGSDSTAAGVVSIYDSSQPLILGKRGNNTQLLAGTIRLFQIRDGIDGTVVGQFDASHALDRVRDAYGNTWTVNGTSWAWQTR